MIAAYVLTDLTEPVRAGAATIYPPGRTLTASEKHAAMQSVLPVVNESAKVVADDVLELVAARLIATLPHEVTCSATYDDDTGCDCIVDQAFDVVMGIRRELAEQSEVGETDG